MNAGSISGVEARLVLVMSSDSVSVRNKRFAGFFCCMTTACLNFTGLCRKPLIFLPGVFARGKSGVILVQAVVKVSEVELADFWHHI